MDFSRYTLEREKPNCYECRPYVYIRSRIVSLKILITGDSFAANWPNGDGWPNMLARRHDVTNLAQAGVSEYKILQQIKRSNLENFDKIIISHTSPSRVHTKKHPIHKKGLHKDCDLIYTDIVNRNYWFNPALRAARDWFKYHYDDEYQIDMYILIRKEIRTLLSSHSCLNITHTDISNKYTLEHNAIDFSGVWRQHKGKINHYTQKGNEIVFKNILDIIEL